MLSKVDELGNEWEKDVQLAMIRYKKKKKGFWKKIIWKRIMRVIYWPKPTIILAFLRWKCNPTTFSFTNGRNSEPLKQFQWWTSQRTLVNWLKVFLKTNKSNYFSPPLPIHFKTEHLISGTGITFIKLKCFIIKLVYQIYIIKNILFYFF